MALLTSFSLSLGEVRVFHNVQNVSVPLTFFLFFIACIHTACQRHHLAVQSFAGGLWECQDREEQQLQPICKRLTPSCKIIEKKQRSCVLHPFQTDMKEIK